MRGLFLAVALILALSGCATGEKVRSFQPGMSKAEVVASLGNPDGFKRVGEYEFMKYTNRLISGWSWDRTDYVFVFQSGELIEYNSGEVRERNPVQGHIIYPVGF